MLDINVFHGDAETVGDDLGEGGLVTLTVTVGAGLDGDFAGGVDAHKGALPLTRASAEGANHGGGGKATGLDGGGEANADEMTTLGAGSGLLGAQLVVAK